MGYRIRYGQRHTARHWVWIAACAGTVVCCGWVYTKLLPQLTAGEGLYDTLARAVGGMIRSAY